MIARRLLMATLATLGLALAPAAEAITLDFEQFVHGEVISGTTVSGVTITAFNPHKAHDYGVVFDTRVSGSNDPDLEAGDPAWLGGNLSEANLGFDPELGNILVVQRFGTDCESGICRTPDDQGGGGGGTMLDFVFAQDITSVGWDLVDIDSSETAGFITLHSGAMQVSFLFGDLLPAALFGDGTANRFAPILATDVGFQSIDRVTITFGGSGGIDNLTFEPVPEPSTIALLGVGLLGLASQARRRH
jgi:hypothetical protein